MADLTIKFKNNPIVELSESGTKTLKTAGKYCEDDITVEYAKPAGGGGGGFAETICEVAGNNNVSSNWSPVVTAEEHIPKKYYYNGVLLPEIPADVLAEYPYCWIRNDGANSKYNLVFSKTPWYYTGTGLSKGTSENIPYYSVNFSEYETAIEWSNQAFSAYEFGLSSNRTVLWSNHDIPNGSATATEIYFEGSEPVLA